MFSSDTKLFPLTVGHLRHLLKPLLLAKSGWFVIQPIRKVNGREKDSRLSVRFYGNTCNLKFLFSFFGSSLKRVLNPLRFSFAHQPELPHKPSTCSILISTFHQPYCSGNCCPTPLPVAIEWLASAGVYFNIYLGTQPRKSYTHIVFIHSAFNGQEAAVAVFGNISRYPSSCFPWNNERQRPTQSDAMYGITNEYFPKAFLRTRNLINGNRPNDGSSGDHYSIMPPGGALYVRRPPPPHSE